MLDIAINFTHLHTHSNFSVRDGLPSPQDLVLQAKRLGYTSLALTDHGNMGGHYQFASEASKTHIIDGQEIGPLQPIFGIEAYLCEDINKKESIAIIDPKTGIKRSRRPKHYHIILLAKDEIGYNNLREMSYISAKDGFYYEPRIDWNILQEHSDGLICSSACLGGEIASATLRDESKQNTLDLIDKYKQVFNDDFYLEIQMHGIEDEKKAYRLISDYATEMKIPLIATNDIHYITKEDASVHNVFVNMKFNRDLKQGGSGDQRDLSKAYKKPEFYMKSKTEMNKLFSKKIEALQNTQEIIEKCNFKYTFDNSIIWPDLIIDIDDKLKKWRDETCPELNLKQAYLARESLRGLKKKGLIDKKEYVKRLKHELNIIYDLGYDEYFLVQWRICNECNKSGILMGPGRGSGVGSLVLYVLGITHLDPLEYDLIFERFLNPGRGPQFNHTLPIFKEDDINE